MKGKNDRKIPMLVLILYVVATVMSIGIMINIYTSNLYIKSLVEKGFNPSSQLADVMSYYFNAISPYVFYTVVLITLGYIISRINYPSEKVIEEGTNTIEKTSNESNEDDDLDELFEELGLNK